MASGDYVGPLWTVSPTELLVVIHDLPVQEAECIVRVGHRIIQRKLATLQEQNSLLWHISSLTSATQYTYEIRVPGQGILTGPIQFKTFPEPGQSGVPFSFAFGSCHKPDARSWLTPREDPWVIWKWFHQSWVRSGKAEHKEIPRFLCMIGDQIYADSAWKACIKMLRSRPASPPTGLQDMYDQIYRKHFSHPLLRDIYAHFPVFMMWDDHEIRDGWGSSGTEGREIEQRIFRSALASCRKYQMMHNLYLSGNELYYAFMYGDVGFLVPDLRTYRDRKKRLLMGEQQKEWFVNTLYALSELCPLIFVLCSVPIIHLSNYIHMMGKGWFGKILIHLFGVADDFADQWNSPEHEREARWVLDHIFHIMNTRHTTFVILGGDVHVGTWAILRSSDPVHERRPAFYQFTSSPVSNAPNVFIRLLPRWGQKIQFGKTYHARVLEVFPWRNIGFVHIRPYRDTYRVICELAYSKHGRVMTERFPILI